VSPTPDFDDVALGVQVVVNGMGIGDEVALVAFEQLVDGGTVVLLGVAVEHMLLRRDQHPEVILSALLLCEHQHAGRIDAEVWLAEGIDQHDGDERPGQLGQLLVPRAQRRLREIEPLTGIDPFQAVEGLVILPATDDAVGEHARAGEPTLDRQLDCLGR
jgi:hypothetical protein